MGQLEDRVAEHYTTEDLIGSIRAALEATGVDPDTARARDLKAVDEFHIGGVDATRALLDQVGTTAETRVLDIGSGLGGTARFVAETYGCAVTGIDLTPAFVETARALSDLVGLSDRTTFEVGSATDLPLEAGRFDVATMLHVGMNIPDKAGVMAEAFRVLRPGGTFAVYDVMRTGDGAFAFPVPWSEVPENSFLATVDAYRDAALAAGFEAAAPVNRRDYALAFFAEQKARIEREGAQIVGVHLLMGETRAEKIQNMVTNISAGLIAPVELMLRKPE